MFSTTAFVILIILMITQIIKLFRSRHFSYEVEQIFFLIAAFMLFIDFGYRSYRISFPAVTNTYEALVFFSGVLCILLYFLGRRIVPSSEEAEVDEEVRGDRVILFIGTVVVSLFLALASSPLVPDTLVLPVPALQSYWLVAHVVLSFVGESFFVVAFAASVVFLTTSSKEKRSRADRITYISILIGYVFFTTGALVFGMIWAEQAWGSYWSWDPKETWALVTWLTYTLYLHMRMVSGKKMVPGKRGRFSSWISIAGFLLTMFTFFGVNYLMSGLHSYV